MFSFKKNVAPKPAKTLNLLNAGDIHAVSGGKPGTTPNLAAQCCNGKHFDSATLTTR